MLEILHNRALLLSISWFGFFATTVWGHIGSKLAVRSSGPSDVWRAMISPLGMSVLLAWIFSAAFWFLIISAQSVVQANSISQLRYPLVCLAAMLILRESLDTRQILGGAIILFGLMILSSGNPVHPSEKALEGGVLGH